MSTVRAFSGSEPLVGELTGLRTFRVEESGRLLPMFADGAWSDGTNTAVCAPPGGAAELLITLPRSTASAVSTPTEAEPRRDRCGNCATSTPNTR